jgi:predicted phosphodiesterase
MTALQLAKDLIKEKTENGVCTLSKKKLGELLHARYPTIFPSNEHGRTSVRRLTGSTGKEDRRKIKIRMEWPGLQLPEPEKNDYSKFHLKDQRICLLSDIHFPYFDKEALNASIKYLKSWGPDCILLNGDVIDCYQLSNWEKDPRNRSFKYELDLLRSFVRQIRKFWPKKRIIYKIGNHEERYEKVILQRVPEFVDLELFSLESVLGLRDLGVEIVKNKRVILAGKLNIIHGHELQRGIAAPVNPARGFYLKCKANVIGSHHHQTSEHFENDLNGQVTGAWSTGCLCDLHPHYAPVNKWNSGFATIENFGSDFKVTNLKIIKGKVM